MENDINENEELQLANSYDEIRKLFESKVAKKVIRKSLDAVAHAIAGRTDLTAQEIKLLQMRYDILSNTDKILDLIQKRGEDSKEYITRLKEERAEQQEQENGE